MLKINFDFDELLGDIISFNGLYIDFLDCNEYTIWYLIRQAGIKSFLPVLNTKAFYNNKSKIDEIGFGIYRDLNLKEIKNNLNKYYNIKIVHFDKTKSNFIDFIRDGIGKKQFIFTLYDFYYDTLVSDPKVHDLHGHPVTGIDDERDIFLSLLPGKYEVRFVDLERMLREYIEVSSEAENYCFYLDTSKFNYPNDTKVLNVIQTDIINTINDWKEEIEYFNQYIIELNKVISFTQENKKNFVLKERLLFNSIMEGMHGNFIFKLRLISENYNVSTYDFEEEFFNNRKQSIIISNLYRKAAVILEDDEAYFNDLIRRISQNIYKFFVVESSEILYKFREFIRKEGIVDVFEN